MVGTTYGLRGECVSLMGAATSIIFVVTKVVMTKMRLS